MKQLLSLTTVLTKFLVDGFQSFADIESWQNGCRNLFSDGWKKCPAPKKMLCLIIYNRQWDFVRLWIIADTKVSFRIPVCLISRRQKSTLSTWDWKESLITCSEIKTDLSGLLICCLILQEELFLLIFLFSFEKLTIQYACDVERTYSCRLFWSKNCINSAALNLKSLYSEFRLL